MAVSMLEWMQRFQQKYSGVRGYLGPESQLVSEMHSPIKSTNSVDDVIPVKQKLRESTPQKSLDAFLKKPKVESQVYDENFGEEDFRFILEQWRAKNLIHEKEEVEAI
jgi:hypothetical protein